MKPVYMINGFLESGKTEFITYTIAQPYFRTKGKTLIMDLKHGKYLKNSTKLIARKLMIGIMSGRKGRGH